MRQKRLCNPDESVKPEEQDLRRKEVLGEFHPIFSSSYSLPVWQKRLSDDSSRLTG